MGFNSAPGKAPTADDLTKLIDASAQNNGIGIEDAPEPGSSVATLPNGIPGDSSADANNAEGDEFGYNVVRAGTPFAKVGMQTPGVSPGMFHTFPFTGGDANLWDQTYIRDPADREAAIGEGANLENEEGTRLAGAIGRIHDQQSDMVANQIAQRQTDQNNLRMRQEALDKATENYSNNLAAGGNFWARPTSIFSAIGAVLMGLSAGMTGHGDAGTTTYNILNNAIQADFEQRKYLLDRGIVDKRNNLQSYREIMGNQEDGDRMALAESYRVGALELERIAAQFKGPKAIARAREEAAKLRQMAGLLRMSGNKGAYMPPGSVSTTVLPQYAAENTANPGAAVPTSGSWNTKPKMPPTGPSLSTGQGMAKAVSGGGMAIGGPVPGSAGAELAKERGLALPYGMSQEQANKLDERVPGTVKRLYYINKENIESVAARLGLNAEQLGLRPTDTAEQLGQKLGPYAAKFNSAMQEKVREEAAKDNEVVSKQLMPISQAMAVTRKTLAAAAVIEQVAKANGVNPDSLNNTTWKQITPADWIRKYQMWLQSDRGVAPNIAQRRADEAADMMSDFNQLFSTTAADWIHEHAGASFTAGEKQIEARAAPVNGNETWRFMKNFMNSRSQQLQAATDVALKSAKSPLTTLAWEGKLGRKNPGASFDAPVPASKTFNRPKGQEEPKLPFGTITPELTRRAIERLNKAK